MIVLFLSIWNNLNLYAPDITMSPGRIYQRHPRTNSLVLSKPSCITVARWEGGGGAPDITGIVKSGGSK